MNDKTLQLEPLEMLFFLVLLLRFCFYSINSLFVTTELKKYLTQSATVNIIRDTYTI